jgi:hypothetical protein
VRQARHLALIAAALAALLALPALASAAKQPRAAQVDILAADPTGVVAGESTHATVRISNDGRRPLPSRELLVRLNGDGSGVLARTTIPRLQPNRSAKLELDVPVPLDASPGAQNLRACRAQKDNGDKCGKARLDTPLTVIAPADLELSPAGHDFGTHATGTSAPPESFTLRNTGGAPSGVPSVDLGGGAGEFSLASNTCTAALGPGESCTFEAGFGPTSVGAKDAAIAASAMPGGVAAATLAGTGANPANLTISPTPHGFGTHAAGTTSPTQTFTVTNTGDVPSGTIATALAGVDPNQFTKSADNCNGQILGPGQSCTLDGAFSPSSAGAKAAALQASASPGGTASAALSGTVTQANLAISPTNHPFGTFVLPNSSSVQTFTVTNNGGAPSGTISTSLTGTNSNQFTKSADNCDGQTLGSGQSCTMGAAFTPNAGGGAKIAALEATASPGGTASASLSGTSQTPANLEITPAPFNFGNVQQGTDSQVQRFEIKNTGEQTSGIVAVGFGTQSPAARYSGALSGCGGGQTLAAGASCFLDVTFEPLSGDAGTTFTTSVIALASPGGSPSASVSGTAVATAASLSMHSDAQTSFSTTGDTLSGPTDSRSLVVVVQNTGAADSGPVSYQETINSGNVALTGVNLVPVLGHPACPAQGGVIPGNTTCSLRWGIRGNTGGANAWDVTFTVSATPGGSVVQTYVNTP